MVRHDYECSYCGHEEEHFKSIHEDFLTHCPHCNTEGYHIVYKTAPQGLVKADPTTVGLQAYRNTQKMGNNEVEERARKEKIERQQKIRERNERSLMPGVTLKEPPKTTPFWRTEAPDLSLANMTPKEKTNYIQTGSKTEKLTPSV